MKKLIDVSAFASVQLQRYLERSPANLAVITDFAGIETFKREGFNNVQHAFRLLSSFSSQVLVLKPTRVISLLRPRRKGLHYRLIDAEATAGFPVFAKMLTGSSELKASAISRDYGAKHAKAVTYLKQQTLNAELVRDGFLAVTQSFRPAVMSAIRSRSPLPPGFHEGIRGHIIAVAQETLKRLFPQSVQTFPNAYYSYPFRYTLSMYALNLIWMATGDVKTAPADLLRNDATDMTYVAYATMFDGIITEDRKLAAIYGLSRRLLCQVFGVPD